MKLNKVLMVAIAGLGLAITGCAKQEVASTAAPKAAAPTTQAVQAHAAKPASNAVYFAFNSADLDAAGSATLDAYAAWLNDKNAVAITIEGNCDQRGSREYNLALGQQRADSVKGYLVERGVSASRIDTVSFGEERAACSGTGEACWAQNRHADIVSR